MSLHHIGEFPSRGHRSTHDIASFQPQSDPQNLATSAYLSPSPSRAYPAPINPPAPFHLALGPTIAQSGIGTPVRIGNNLAASSRPSLSLPAMRHAKDEGLVGCRCKVIRPSHKSGRIMDGNGIEGVPAPRSATVLPLICMIPSSGHRTANQHKPNLLQSRSPGTRVIFPAMTFSSG